MLNLINYIYKVFNRHISLKPAVAVSFCGAQQGRDMLFQSLSPQNRWMRFIALAVCVFFFTTQLGFAETPLPLASNLKIEPAPERTGINADFIAIPKELGEVLRSYEGSQRGLVVHIQDAHSNFEAQRHIGEILKYLSETQGLQLVNVEGGSGRLYTSLFSSYPDPKVRQVVGDYLLEEDKLTGPEWMAMTAKPGLVLNGIEDNRLYENNRRVFLDALNFKHQDEEILKKIEDLLQTVSAYILPDTSREFFKQKRKFRDNQTGLPEYLHYLTSVAAEQKIGIANFASIRNFLKLVSLQNKINYEQAEDEMALLITDLKHQLDGKSFRTLQGHYLGLKSGSMSREEFYAILSGMVPPEKIDKKRFGNVFRYFKYVRLYRHVNVGIFDEIEALENGLARKILSEKDQARLGELFDYLEIYEKIFRFSLTQKEADFFFENRGQFKASSFREYLEPFREQFHIETSLPSDLEKLDDDLSRIEKFYLLALERDSVLIENAVKAMETSGMKICALITGGFHTPGIERSLRSRGFSYLVIQPSIKEKLDVEKDSRKYEKSLQETPSDLEKFLKQAYFSPQSSKLNDPRYQLAARAHAPDDIRMSQIELEMAEAAARGKLDLSEISSLAATSQKTSLLAFADARLNGAIHPPESKDLPEADRPRAAEVLHVLYAPFDKPFVMQSPAADSSKNTTIVITKPLANGRVITAVAEPWGAKTSELESSLGDREEIHLGNDRLTLASMERWSAELVKDRLTGKRSKEPSGTLAMAASLGGIQTKTLVNRLLKDLQHEFDLAKGAAVMADKQILASKRIRSFRDRLNRVRVKVETLEFGLPTARTVQEVRTAEAVLEAFGQAEKYFQALQDLNDFNKEAVYLLERKDMIEQLMVALKQQKVEGLTKKELDKMIQRIQHRINSLQERNNVRLGRIMESSAKTELDVDGVSFGDLMQKFINGFEERQATGVTAGQPSSWIQHLEAEAKALISEKRAEWKLSQLASVEPPQSPLEEILPPISAEVGPLAQEKPQPGTGTQTYGDVFTQWYEEGGVFDTLMGFGVDTPEEEHPLLNDETEEAIAVLAGVPEVQQTSARRNAERGLSTGWLVQDAVRRGNMREPAVPYVIPLFDPNKPQTPSTPEPKMVEAEVLAPAPVVIESPLRRFWNTVLWVLGILFYPLVLLDRAGTAVFDWFDKILTVKTGRQAFRAEQLETRALNDAAGFEPPAEVQTVRFDEMVNIRFDYDSVAAAQTQAVQQGKGMDLGNARLDVNGVDSVLRGLASGDRGFSNPFSAAAVPISAPELLVEMPDGLQAAEGLITGNVAFPVETLEAGGAAQPETEIGAGLPVFQGDIVPGGGLDLLRQSLGQGNDQVGSFAIVMLTHVYDGDGDGDVDIYLGRSKFDDFDGRVQQAYNFLNTTSTQSQAYSSLITGIGLDGTPLGEVRQAMLTQGFHTIDFSFFNLGRLYDATGDGRVDVNFNADAVTTVALGDRTFEFQTPERVTEGLLYLKRSEAAPLGRLIAGHLTEGTAAQAIHSSLTTDPFGGRYAGIATQVLIHGRVGDDGAFLYTLDTNGDGRADSRDTAYSIVDAGSYGRTITALDTLSNTDAQVVGNFFASRTVAGTVQEDAFNLLLNDTTDGRDPGVFFGMLGGLGDGGDGDLVPDRINDRNRDGAIDELDLQQTFIRGSDMAFTLNAFGDTNNGAAQQIGRFAAGVVPADTALARLRAAIASDSTGRIAGFIETFLQNIFDYDGDGQTDFVIDGNRNGTVSREESETPLFRSGSLYAQALSFFEQNSAQAQILERFISGGYAPDTPLGRIYNAIINDTTGGKQTGFIGSVLFRSFFDYQNTDGVVDFVADFNENGNPDDDTLILSQKMDRLGQALSFLEQSNPDSDIFATFFARDQIEGHQPLVKGGGLDILIDAILTDTPDAEVGGRIFYFLTRSKVVVKEGVETIEYDPSVGKVLSRSSPELAHILRVLNNKGEITEFATGIVGTKDGSGETTAEVPAKFVKGGKKSGGGGGIIAAGGSSTSGGGGGGGGGSTGGGGGGGGGGGSSAASTPAGGGLIFTDRMKLGLTDMPDMRIDGNIVVDKFIEVFLDEDGTLDFREKLEEQAPAEISDQGARFAFRFQIVGEGSDYYFHIRIDDGQQVGEAKVLLYHVPEGAEFPLRAGDREAGEQAYEVQGDYLIVYFHNRGNSDDGRAVAINRRTGQVYVITMNPRTQNLRMENAEGGYRLEARRAEPERREENPPAPEVLQPPREAGRDLADIAAQIFADGIGWLDRMRVGPEQVADRAIEALVEENTADQNAETAAEDSYWTSLVDNPIVLTVAGATAAGAAFLAYETAKARKKKREEEARRQLPAEKGDSVEGASLGAEEKRGGPEGPTRRNVLRTFLLGGAALVLESSGLSGLAAKAQEFVADTRVSLRGLIDRFLGRERELGRGALTPARLLTNITRDLDRASDAGLKFQISHVPDNTPVRYKTQIERTFGQTLHLPLDSVENMTSADWEVKFLEPLMTVLDIDQPDRFVGYFMTAITHSLPHMLQFQRAGLITKDSDVPSTWKSWTGMFSADEWVHVNGEWGKQDFGGEKPKFELDTLLGVSVFLALMWYHDDWPELRHYTNLPAREGYLFRGLRATLNPSPINGVPGIREIVEFEKFIASSYRSVFYSEMWNGLSRGTGTPYPVDVGQAINEKRVFQLARMIERSYPHLTLRGDEIHFLDQLDLARPMMTAILGQKSLWGGRTSSIRQIMRPETFLPMIEMLREMGRQPEMADFYNGHDDPYLARVVSGWKAKRFTIRWVGDRYTSADRSLRAVTLEDFRDRDSGRYFTRTPPGFERIIRYLIAARDSSSGIKRRIYEDWIEDEVLKAAVGLEVGRKLFWIRYGLETNLIRVTHGPTGRPLIHSAAFFEKIRSMQRLLPYVKDFFGIEGFNANNPDHIGRLSAMETAMRKMALPPSTFTFVLQVSTRDDVKRQVRAILHAATGDESFLTRDFDFTDIATGSDQVGSVMGWVFMRLKEGWDATDGKARGFINLLTDRRQIGPARRTRRQTIIDLANRKKAAFNQLFKLKVKEITEETLRRDLSLVGDIFAMTTDALNDGAMRSDDHWNAWVAKQERTIELLFEFRRDQQRKAGVGRLEGEEREGALAFVENLAARQADILLVGLVAFYGPEGEAAAENPAAEVVPPQREEEMPVVPEAMPELPVQPVVPANVGGKTPSAAAEATPPAAVKEEKERRSWVYLALGAGLTSAGYAAYKYFQSRDEGKKPGESVQIPAEVPAGKPVSGASLGAAVGQVQKIGQENRLNAELEKMDSDAAELGVQLDRILADALFGAAAAEKVNSVQLFDFNEGLLTPADLADQNFLKDYFADSSSHKMILVVTPEQVEMVRALIPEGYKNRIELIQAADIRQGFVQAQQLFPGYRIVVNTVQPDDRRVTADDKTDQIYEISTEPEALTRLANEVALRRAMALGGRNLAFAGAFGGALSDQEGMGFAPAGSDYIRFTRADLEALIVSISVEAEAERLRAKSA